MFEFDSNLNFNFEFNSNLDKDWLDEIRWCKNGFCMNEWAPKGLAPHEESCFLFLSPFEFEI